MKTTKTQDDTIIQKAKNMLLKSTVRGVYDLQKLRISMGNRLVAQFKTKMGYVPGKKEKDCLDDEVKDILKEIESTYKKITDGIKKELPSRNQFKAQGIISEYAELVMIHQYISLESEEESQFRRLNSILVDCPIWNSFLSGVRGCGPAMAGAIISSIDISKAEYVSSLWKYCGYDVVMIGRDKVSNNPVVALSINDFGTEALSEIIASDTSAVAFAELKEREWEEFSFKGEGRGKYKHHQITKQLKDESGEVIKEWKGLTYNPWIKSKLWVMANCFLKDSLRWVEVSEEEYKSLPEIMRDEEKGTFYKQVVTNDHPYVTSYLNYRNRKVNDPTWSSKPKAHIHNASLRYMIKRFLADLYKAWRPLEGLTVAPEYSEAKLGMIHGKADKYRKAA
jgi:hypothetical protein